MITGGEKNLLQGFTDPKLLYARDAFRSLSFGKRRAAAAAHRQGCGSGVGEIASRP